MANFQTHLLSATLVSGILAGQLVIIEFATPKAAFFYWLLGTLGGILPDIDAPNALPTRLLFTTLGLLAAILALVSQVNRVSLEILLPLVLPIYLHALPCIAVIFIRY